MTPPVEFPSEAVFQRTVMDLIRTLGLLAYHPNNPQRDAPGFPDKEGGNAAL